MPVLFLLNKVFQSIDNLLIAASHKFPNNNAIEIRKNKHRNNCDYK